MGRLLAGIVVAGVVLAACGEDDETGDAVTTPATATDRMPATGTAVFRGLLEDGATLTVRLDVPETDPVIAPFAGYRSEAGATDPIVWLVGSLDAPADYDSALGPPTGRFITFLPSGADLIEDDATNPKSEFACAELDDWFGTPTGEAAAALNDVYLEVFAGSCNSESLMVTGAPGEVTDYAMFVEGEELPEFESLHAGLVNELEPVQ